MSYEDRSALGKAAEERFIEELKARGWQLHRIRESFPSWLNDALTGFRDSYYRPCHLRWLPDFLIARPNEPNSLRSVDVKRASVNRNRSYNQECLHVEQRALRTYVEWENFHHCPVIVVFHLPGGFNEVPIDAAGEQPEWLAIAADKAELNGLARHSAHSQKSSPTPYYEIDKLNTSPLDRFFGPRLDAAGQSNTPPQSTVSQMKRPVQRPRRPSTRQKRSR